MLRAAILATLVLSGCGGSDGTGDSSVAAAEEARAIPAETGSEKPVGNGPFGLPTRASIDDLKKLGAEERKLSGWYEIKRVPKPHPSFEQVIVWAFPETGAFLVRGVGVDIQSGSQGGQVQSKMDELAAQISSKYGQPSESTDEPAPGSIWNEPEDYMMGLVKKERYVYRRWDRPKNAGPEWSGIRQIYIGAQAVDTDTAYVNLEYYLENYDQCEKAERTNAAKSL